MIKKNHLYSFQVENFKKFRRLSLNDLGQFNLIVGDNNVGKTSVLEALLFDRDLQVFSKNLYSALNFKNLGGSYKEGHFSFFVNKDAILESNNGEVILKFRFRTNEDLEKKGKDNEWVEGEDICFDQTGNFYLVNILSEKGLGVGGLEKANGIEEGFVSPLLPFSFNYGRDLSHLYSKYIIRDRKAKKRLLNLMSVLIPDIEDIEFDTVISDYSVLVVATKNSSSVVPLVNFGDGAIKLFRILMCIIVFRGKRIMIDEIDAGIHYSRFKDFWKTILLAAWDNDVQLFATTHNQECIQYFKDALEEIKAENRSPNLADGRIIKILKGTNSDEISSLTYTYEKFDHALEMENELR